MTRFNKLWGMIGGSFVGMIFSALAVYGIAECTDIANAQSCSVFGISPAIVSTVITAVFGAIGTWRAAPNTP